MGLSTGDKVKAKYNRHKSTFDWPEKTVDAGTEGRVTKVHLLSGDVDVAFVKSAGGGGATTHRDVPQRDLERA